jgi:phosphatidylinositol alpha-1,6-mannosyltransferase
MKVLLFTLEYPPFKGGIANYYQNIVKYWPEPADFFVLADSQNKSHDKKITYTPLLFRFIYPRWVLSFFKLFSQILKYKIDHILVGHLLPLGTVTYFVSRISRTKYSVIIHGMDFAFALRKKRKRFLSALILKNSQKIICSNSYVASLLTDFLGENYSSKIEVVNPGVDAGDFKYNKDLADKLIKKYDLSNKIILLSIGRLVKRKGFDKVVAVMDEVKKAVPNLFYVLAGNGPDKDYIKGYQKNSVDILYLDNLSDEEKWTWLALCDIFIMPSRNIDGDFEGFGIVYLEASLARKPVIGGNSGGIPDAVKEAYSGILVDPDDTEKIKEAIVNLATNKELCQKLGQQGRARALDDFNWPKQIKKMHYLLNT